MSVFAVMMKKPVIPPVDPWVQKWDDSYWNTVYGQGEWVPGVGWYSGVGGGQIEIRDETRTWADGYRPTHIRFTISGATSLTSISIRDKYSSELVEVLGYASETPIEIPWASTDGFEIVLYDEDEGDWYITNIEFLE